MFISRLTKNKLVMNFLKIKEKIIRFSFLATFQKIIYPGFYNIVHDMDHNLEVIFIKIDKPLLLF